MGIKARNAAAVANVGVAANARRIVKVNLNNASKRMVVSRAVV